LFTIVSYKIFSIYLNNKKVRWGWSAVFSYIISFGFRCTIWSVNRIASTQSPKFNKMHVVALYSGLSSNHLLIYFYQIWLIVSESSSLIFIIKYCLSMFTTLMYENEILFRCYSLLGYSTQDLLGMNFNEFIHEDDRNKLTEAWSRGKKVVRFFYFVTKFF